MTSRARRQLLCVLAALPLLGCLSPTLPLPPPSEPEIVGPNAQGLVVLQGTAPSGSWITAYNQDLGEGTFEDVRDGRYEIELRASVGHRIVLWYELDGKDSLPLEFRIRAQ